MVRRVVSPRGPIAAALAAAMLLGALLALALAPAAQAQQTEWVRQFGGGKPGGDVAHAADADGNVYVVGFVSGKLVPDVDNPNRETRDAFVRKYAPDGSEVWTRQFGTVDSDRARGVAVEAGGGVYVAGWTAANLVADAHAGGQDAFVRKYDAGGTELWTRQFGTAANEEAAGVTVGADGGVYVVGRTGGALAGQARVGQTDAFVRKYAPDGRELWTRQFGTASADAGAGVAVGADGGVYVAGRGGTDNLDAFVRKYARDGRELWTLQFGTYSADAAWGVAVGADGSVYVAGSTDGAFAVQGQHSAGFFDAFVAKIDQPPLADAGGPYAGNEGAAVAINGTASDPDSQSLTTTWAAGPRPDTDPGATCSLADLRALTNTVKCTDNGSYIVVLEADDGVNPPVMATTSLTLGNVPSVIRSVTGPTAPLRLGTAASITVDFTDAGSNDTHTCALAWGDGATTVGTVTETQGSGACTGSHTYAAAGTYWVRVAVLDDDGGSATATYQQSVVVYNPTAP